MKISLAFLSGFIILLGTILFKPAKSDTSIVARPYETLSLQECANPRIIANKLKGNQLNVYVSTIGLNYKNRNCWNKMKTAAEKMRSSARGSAIIIHYIDLANFNPPPDGFYGSEAVRKKVVAQATIDIYGNFQFIPDPLGYGIYKMP